MSGRKRLDPTTYIYYFRSSIMELLCMPVQFQCCEVLSFDSSADKFPVNVAWRRLVSYIFNDVSKEFLPPYLRYLKNSYGNSPEDRLWSCFETSVSMFQSKKRRIPEGIKVWFYVYIYSGCYKHLRLRSQYSDNTRAGQYEVRIPGEAEVFVRQNV